MIAPCKHTVTMGVESKKCGVQYSVLQLREACERTSRAICALSLTLSSGSLLDIDTFAIQHPTDIPLIAYLDYREVVHDQLGIYVYFNHKYELHVRVQPLLKRRKLVAPMATYVPA